MKQKKLMMVLVFKIIQLLKELDNLIVIMKKSLSGSRLQKPSEILVAFYFPLLNSSGEHLHSVQASAPCMLQYRRLCNLICKDQEIWICPSTPDSKIKT